MNYNPLDEAHHTQSSSSLFLEILEIIRCAWSHLQILCAVRGVRSAAGGTRPALRHWQGWRRFDSGIQPRVPNERSKIDQNQKLVAENQQANQQYLWVRTQDDLTGLEKTTELQLKTSPNVDQHSIILILSHVLMFCLFQYHPRHSSSLVYLIQSRACTLPSKKLSATTAHPSTKSKCHC